MEMVSEKKRGAAALVACGIAVGASAVLNKFAMGDGMHPIWVNALRLGLTLLLMLPFCLGKAEIRRAVRHMGKRDLGMSLFSGVMLAVHFACWTSALRYADSVVAVSIWSTFSLITVVGSSVLLKEKTPLPALLGILLAICGVAVCAIGATGARALGVLFAAGAAVTQAVYTLCGRAVRKNVGMMPYTLVVYGAAFVALLASALALRLPMTGLTTRGMLGVLALALICTLGGHSMQSYALKFYKAPTVSTVILTEVFTGPILVFIFLGEIPRLQSVIGGVIILVGVAWYVYYEWKTGKAGALSPLPEDSL